MNAIATTLTPSAAARLQAELSRIENVELPAARDAVIESKDAGDNSENVDFFVAKNEEALLIGRADQIRATLATATIVDEVDTSVVGPGCVVVLDFGDGPEEFYLGSVEDAVDVRLDTLTIASPIGRAVVGAAAGEQVAAELPAGAMQVTVVEIRELAKDDLAA